jgi:hypothetical protein
VQITRRLSVSSDSWEAQGWQLMCPECFHDKRDNFIFEIARHLYLILVVNKISFCNGCKCVIYSVILRHLHLCRLCGFISVNYSVIVNFFKLKEQKTKSAQLACIHFYYA